MNDSSILQKKLWERRNSLRFCESNVFRLINFFKIPSKYNVTHGCNGELELILDYNNRVYKMQIDLEELCLNLLERNGIGNNYRNNPKQKELYHLIQVFSNEDCWLSAFQYIKQKSKK